MCLFSSSLCPTLPILPTVRESLKFVKPQFFPSLRPICHRVRMFMTNPRLPLMKPRDRLRPYPKEWELQTGHRSCTQPNPLSIRNPVESLRESSRMPHLVETTGAPERKPSTSLRNMDCITRENKSLKCWINSKPESTSTRAVQVTKEKEGTWVKDPRDNTRSLTTMNLDQNGGGRTQGETERVPGQMMEAQRVKETG